jgi:F0F1-type ATP synthase assembly protein I
MVGSGIPEPPRESAFVRYSKFGALAFEFIGSIVAGVFIGHQLDRYFGTDPWLVLGMTIAGTVIGFYRMVQILRRFERSL